MDQIEITVDARGRLCPWPLLLTKTALASAPTGAVLCVLADDPLAELDLRALCLRAGHRLLALQINASGELCARIEKSGLR
jgi:tRNA 2-thiouridine synthesizing protein A